MGIEKASMGCFDGYASYVVSVLTFYLLTQDVAMKLEMLHQQYDNATALARTLEANLTGKETHVKIFIFCGQATNLRRTLLCFNLFLFGAK